MSVSLENPVESNVSFIETVIEFSKLDRYIIRIFIKIEMFIRCKADLYERSAS